MKFLFRTLSIAVVCLFVTSPLVSAANAMGTDVVPSALTSLSKVCFSGC